MVKPNFFIVGSVKCGTSALYEYLSEHHNIYMSPVKEPYFFADDFANFRRQRGIEARDEYIALFSKSAPYHKAVGEASAGYMYSSVAISNLRRFNPDAKLIVMVRNPVDLAYSYHSTMLYSRNEDEPDFETAWDLQDVRQKGYHIPETCREPAFLQYGRIARLGDQVENILDIFPRSQVQFVVFDDFVTNTQAVYELVLEFLEVPSDNRTNFPAVNASKTHRIAWLGHFLVAPSPNLKRYYVWLKRKLNVDSLILERALLNLNSRKSQKPPLSPSLRGKILAEFADDIAKLSHLTERDLSRWLGHI